jgi:gluconolactonase
MNHVPFTAAFLGGLVLFAQTAVAVQFQIADPAEFNKIIDTNAVFTTNAFLNSWIEGPVWMPDGQFLLFSDMGNNKLKRLDPPNTLSDFLSPPAQTKYNGNTLDLQERLVSCQSGSSGLRVVLTSNGVATPLVTNCNGLKFISPNDLCVKSDGSIWFTDTGADSGIALGTPGFQSGYNVYRFYQTNGGATVLPVITNGLQRPNGICFSPDETRLYVADDGINWNLKTIRVYSVTSSNTLTGGSLFCSVGSGIADGMKCDVNGRLWTSSGQGVEIFAPDGHLIGKILMTRTANLCFGGPQYKTLYTVGQPYVCSFPVRVAGAVSIRKLAVRNEDDQIRVSWPAPSRGFTLQSAEVPDAGAVWSDIAEGPQVTNGMNEATLPATNAAQFFRLRLE